MNESTKTRIVRGKDFEKKYFSGTVLDIGCGNDLVVSHAQAFDKQHGDANHILTYIGQNSYDTVNSSHCLEHMHNPDKALKDWWQVVRPGGYLVTVVPHENLYEQGQWPSRFNSDHKATFRFKTKSTWSPCSYDIFELHECLPGAQIISATVHDYRYDYKLQKIGKENCTQKAIRKKYMQLIHQLNGKKLLTVPLLDELNIFFSGLGIAVDQTMGSALAQIQIIIQKEISK